MLKEYLKKSKFILVTYKVTKKILLNLKIYLIIKNQKKNLNLINKRKFKKPIPVFFIITQAELWGYQSLYEEFDKDYYFEPYIVVMPDTSDEICDYKKSFEKNLKVFEGYKLSILKGYDQRFGIKKFRSIVFNSPSIIFFDQPNPKLPNDWSIYSVSKSSIIYYVPYGFKLGTNYIGNYNQLLTNSAHKLFCETSYHYSFYKKYGVRKAKNVVISGYPKFDELKKNITLDIDIKNKIKDKKFKKIIIWAPHWTINSTKHGYSTFDKYYDYFLKLKLKRKDFFWIFRPHQCLKQELVKKNFMTKNQVNYYYSQWNDSHNSIYYIKNDYFNVFKYSDALITDCGSFLAEYLAFEKPILHLDSQKSRGYNDIGLKILKTCYSSVSQGEIDFFINKVIDEDIDDLAESRKELKNNLLNIKDEKCASIIFRDIKKTVFKS